MSVTHCVVVWEWWDGAGACWLPHPPAVAQQLERAHAKSLTRVVLADADPALLGHYVNLRTRTQTRDTHDGTRGVECGVRRSCYSVCSPAGRGARWEWARPTSPHEHTFWEQLPMEMQCRVEEAWTRGEQCAEVGSALGAWLVQLASLTARGPGGARRSVRRVQQAPYPLTRAPLPPATHNTVPGRRSQTIPQQHTGSSTMSTISGGSGRTVVSCGAAERRGSGGERRGSGGERRGSVGERGARAERGERASPPRDRAKHNLARQILHNLNIFNIKPARTVELEQLDSRRDTDSTSTRSGRRPSQDTVSTYLSHETAESNNHASVGDLLNCSVGSDDVFDSEPQPSPSRPKTPSSNGSIIKVEPPGVGLRRVARVQWGAVCPLCLRGLEDGAAVVALTHCQHMMHLQCLALSVSGAVGQGAMFVECGVCGATYGAGPGGGGGGCGGGGVLAGGGGGGDQPAGSMAWCVQHRALPNHPPDTYTIQITYNMMSGTQSAEHPSPGQPYYAVGFPRYSYLPDTPLGRRVLNLLCLAWERRLLFTIGRSQTTGREDVVTWAHGLRLRSERGQFAAGAVDSAAYLHALVRHLAALGVSDAGSGSGEANLYQELH